MVYYVGSFNNTSGRMVICDPMCAVSMSVDEVVSLPSKVSSSVRCCSGLWDAYRVGGGLACISSKYSSDLEVYNKAYCSCSGIVCVVDKAYFGDAKYCSCSIEDMAKYSKNDIVGEYWPEKRKDSDFGISVYGSALKVVGMGAVNHDKVRSSHWSTDIMRRIEEQVSHTAVVKNGIAAQIRMDDCVCKYLLRDNEVVAIFVEKVGENRIISNDYFESLRSLKNISFSS